MSKICMVHSVPKDTWERLKLNRFKIFSVSYVNTFQNFVIRYNSQHKLVSDDWLSHSKKQTIPKSKRSTYIGTPGVCRYKEDIHNLILEISLIWSNIFDTYTDMRRVGKRIPTYRHRIFVDVIIFWWRILWYALFFHMKYRWLRVQWKQPFCDGCH